MFSMISRKDLNVTNIVSVCTDGAPSMAEKSEESVVHLKKKLVHHDALTSFHCVSHRQNLSAKFVNLDDILKKVVGIVNFIRANALRHRQFRHMLMLDDEITSENLLYHSKVHCLSQGQILVKILSLSEKVMDLFYENDQNCKLSKANFFKVLPFCMKLRPSKMS